MSNAARKRNVKWDYKEESEQPLKENDWRMRESELRHNSSDCHGDRYLDRSSAKDANCKLKVMHEMRVHSREPWARGRGMQNDDGTSEDFSKNLKPTSECDGSGGYRSKRSSGRDDYRHNNSHHSPRKDWLRSHRSSRSRSRSRSRSPIYGYKKQIGSFDRSRSRSRSGASAQQSDEYIGGKNRRENDRQCVRQAVHSDEDAWDARERKTRDSKFSIRHDTRDQAIRAGRSRYDVASWEHEDDRRDGDTFREPSHVKSGFHRNSDIPCKFFAVGNCRSGRHCRFSHHVDMQRSPDRKLRDDKRGWYHSSHYMEKSWKEPKFVDAEKLDVARSGDFNNGNMVGSGQGMATWGQNDGLSSRLHPNNMVEESAVASKAVKITKDEANQWRPGTGRLNAGLAESKGNGNWLEDMEMSPDWNYGIRTSNSSLKDEHSCIAQTSQPVSLNNTGLPSYEHQRVKEASWRPEATTSLPSVIDNHHLQQDRMYGASNACASSEKIASEKFSTQRDLNNSLVTSEQVFDPRRQVSGVKPYSTTEAFRDARASIPTGQSRGLTIKTFENGTLSQANSSNDISVSRETDTTQTGVGSVPQHLVKGSQIGQITSISASLAQIFGSGQPLPQLYGSLNPQSAMQMPSTLNTQPNQVFMEQKQYDPISDSIEAKQPDGSAEVCEAPKIFCEKTSIEELNPETQPNSLTSTAANKHANDHRKGLNPEKEPNDRSQGLHQSEGLEPIETSQILKENTEARTEKSEKVKVDSDEPAPASQTLENVDADGKSGESKKGKDLKAFKFALVEMAKQLLKPAWKEGRVSKDSYKKIVKKVVDKVTGTMQGANVPQTQEKIDHYLSVSKPKLTKLVQAYVGKFQKGPN